MRASPKETRWWASPIGPSNPHRGEHIPKIGASKAHIGALNVSCSSNILVGQAFLPLREQAALRAWTFDL